MRFTSDEASEFLNQVMSMILGVIGLVAAVLQMVDPAVPNGVGSFIACLIFYLVLGWKVYSLSKASQVFLKIGG